MSATPRPLADRAVRHYAFHKDLLDERLRVRQPPQRRGNYELPLHVPGVAIGGKTSPGGVEERALFYVVDPPYGKTYLRQVVGGEEMAGVVKAGVGKTPFS